MSKISQRLTKEELLALIPLITEFKQYIRGKKKEKRL